MGYSFHRSTAPVISVKVEWETIWLGGHWRSQPEAFRFKLFLAWRSFCEAGCSKRLTKEHACLPLAGTDSQHISGGYVALSVPAGKQGRAKDKASGVLIPREQLQGTEQLGAPRTPGSESSIKNFERKRHISTPISLPRRPHIKGVLGCRELVSWVARGPSCWKPEGQDPKARP